MRSSRNNSDQYNSSRRDNDSDYENRNYGYSDRYIYQRDFEDYNEPLQNRASGQNDDDYSRGYESPGASQGDPSRNYGRFSRNRQTNLGSNEWNEGYDRGYGDAYAGYRNNNGSRHGQDRNIFRRAGEKIRDTWNDIRQRQDDRQHDQDDRPRHPDDNDNWGQNDNYPYPNEAYYRDRDRNGNNHEEFHWGNNSRYNNDRGSRTRSSGPHHDYSYGHSGSLRWSSRDNNDRYYNGLSKGY